MSRSVPASDHEPRTIVWIFLAIANHTPDDPRGAVLADILFSADHIERGVPSREQVQHCVRDLIAAGLIHVDAGFFRETPEGTELRIRVWREYKRASMRGEVVFPADVGQTILPAIACAADRPTWSVSQKSWADAVSAYRAFFRAADAQLRRTSS